MVDQINDFQPQTFEVYSDLNYTSLFQSLTLYEL